MHVVHSNKDAQKVPCGSKLQFLIVSYNFVPKMVSSSGAAESPCEGGEGQHRQPGR